MRSIRVLCVLLVLLVPLGLFADIGVRVVSVQSTITNSNFIEPTGVVSDSLGNIYVGQCSTSASSIFKIDAKTHAVSVYLTQANNQAFNCVQFLAMDSSNNLYIADSYNRRIVKWSTTNNSLDAVYTTGTAAPIGLALDSSGNLYYSSQSPNAVGEIPAGSPTGSSGTTVLTDATWGTINGITFDANDNLYVTDTQGNTIYEYAKSGGGYSTSSKSTFLSGLFYPVQLYFDSGNNAYVTQHGSGMLVEFLAPGYTVTSRLSSDIAGPHGIAADPQGNLFVTATSGNSVIEVRPGNTFDLGSPKVGSSTSAVLNLQVFNGFNLAPPAYYDQGNSGLEFTTTTSSNPCPTGAYSSTTYCTLGVQFAPTFPGLRQGGVAIMGGGGFTFARVYLSGVGVAPQAVFDPGTITPLGNGGLYKAQGIAVDAAGNIFVADTGGSEVLEIPWTGSGYGTQVTIGSGFNRPAGIAVDGNGNLFVADTGNNRVVEVPLTSSGYGTPTAVGSGFSGPEAVAMDGMGNLFVADTGNSQVVELPHTYFGFGNPDTLASGLGTPSGISVDASGNVLVANSGSDTITEIPWNGSGYGTATTVLSQGLAGPTGLATDAAGDIYVFNYANGSVTESRWNGTGYTTPDVLYWYVNGGPALDAAGNIYFTSQPNFGPLSNHIIKIDRSTATALKFATTNVGSTSTDSPHSFTLSNIGNDALSFPVPTTGANPSLSLSDFVPTVASICPLLTASSPSAGSLAAGMNCIYAINFSPQTSGALSGTFTLTDNTLNAVGPNYATQSVSLSGTGIAIADTTSTAVSASASQIAPNQTVDLTATVTDSTDSTKTPTGTVSFTDQVGSTVTTLNSGVTLSNGVAKLTGVTLSGLGVHTITANYSGVSNTFLTSSNTTTVTVAQITPTINWSPASSIAYGTTLANLLNATATDSSNNTINGSFAYTAAPTGGSAAAVTGATLLAPGTYTLAVTFTPTDTTTYTTATASADLTVTTASTTTTLTSSTSNANLGQTITFTATVAATNSGTPGTPTGTVTFYSGSNVLGSGTLSNGVVTYQTSSLAAGTYSITAQYGGDDDFNGSTSQALQQQVTAPDYSITANPTSLVIKRGSSGSATLTITPVGGYTGTVNFSCSGLPEYASCIFTPSSLTLPGDNKAQTVSLLVTTPGATAMNNLPGSGGVLAALSWTSFGAFGFLAMGDPKRKKKLLRRSAMLVLLVIALAAMLVLSGCGAGSCCRLPSPPTGTTTATVTASATGTGTSSGVTQHTASITITIE